MPWRDFMDGSRFQFRTVPSYRRHYRARLLMMPKQALRGVIRGSVFRFRAMIPGGASAARVAKNRTPVQLVYRAIWDR
jgi:hypothetical protein